MILVPRGEYGPPALEEIHKIRKPILQCRTVVVIVNYPVVVVNNPGKITDPQLLLNQLKNHNRKFTCLKSSPAQ